MNILDKANKKDKKDKEDRKEGCPAQFYGVIFALCAMASAVAGLRIYEAFSPQASSTSIIYPAEQKQKVHYADYSRNALNHIKTRGRLQISEYWPEEQSLLEFYGRKFELADMLREQDKIRLGGFDSGE